MTHRQELALGVAAIIVVSIGIDFFGTGGAAKNNGRTADKQNAVILPVPAAPSPEIIAQLKASHGFQALVSYADNGFAPSAITIKRGETIRFTNNSKADLWVAATGASGAVYPGRSVDECGQSAFDSCRVIVPGGFWEFTFDTVGTWGYQNNRDTNMTATVTIN